MGDKIAIAFNNTSKLAEYVKLVNVNGEVSVYSNADNSTLYIVVDKKVLFQCDAYALTSGGGVFDVINNKK